MRWEAGYGRIKAAKADPKDLAPSLCKSGAAEPRREGGRQAWFLRDGREFIVESGPPPRLAREEVKRQLDACAWSVGERRGEERHLRVWVWTGCVKPRGGGKHQEAGQGPISLFNAT